MTTSRAQSQRQQLALPLVVALRDSKHHSNNTFDNSEQIEHSEHSGTPRAT